MEPYSNLKNLQTALFNRKTSIVDVVQSFINKIENNDHNIFLETFREESLKSAVKIDEKIKNKTAGKLAGLVVGIKDNICYKNHKVSAASKILNNFHSTYSATVVDRLINEDAVIIGRVNCDEFAMGSTNENSVYGPVKNPLNPLLTPGGSSGGCAAAISAKLCHVTLGSDTGGSVRQPAAFCGVIGLKPSYGMISRHGLIAYASSFDQIGPLGSSTYDIDKVMEVICGRDDFDTTCVFNGCDYKKEFSPITKMRISVIKEVNNHSLIHPDVKKSFELLISNIKKSGHEINFVDMPILKYLVPSYYVLTTAEASSNLARYDGIKYGFSERLKTNNWEELVQKTRSKGFGPEVKRRILLGSFVLSEGYYDDYYTKAQKVRRIVSEQTNKILEKSDFILMPTSPTIPFKLNEEYNDPTVLYLQDVFTVQANLSGCPSLSIPIHKFKTDAPVGAQLITKKSFDKKLLLYGQKILNNYV